MKFAYPCRIKETEVGYSISFRNFKEICCECTSYEDALESAEEYLNRLLENILEDGGELFFPETPKKDEVLIPVSQDILEKLTSYFEK